MSFLSSNNCQIRADSIRQANTLINRALKGDGNERVLGGKDRRTNFCGGAGCTGSPSQSLHINESCVDSNQSLSRTYIFSHRQIIMDKNTIRILALALLSLYLVCSATIAQCKYMQPSYFSCYLVLSLLLLSTCPSTSISLSTGYSRVIF